LEYTKGGAIASGEQTTPVVDGKIIPTHPFDPVAAPTASHVPPIIGSNKDEMTLFLSIDQRNGQSLEYDEETMRKTIMGRIRRWVDRKAMTAKLENLIATYRQTRPGATPNELLIAITSDQTRVSSIRLAERKSAGGTAPVYMYLFTWESPVSRGRLKSAHTFEIPFVFNNVDPSIRLVGNAPERLTLAANMSKAWVAFTRSGNPNHEGAPHWPTYTTEKRATMIFDTECRVENDPQSKERKAWDEII
jgi:para-nitrobenzyl esterase